MKYLVAIHHPDDYNPAVSEDEAMDRDIDARHNQARQPSLHGANNFELTTSTLRFRRTARSRQRWLSLGSLGTTVLCHEED
jgi:hypothetical protein